MGVSCGYAGVDLETAGEGVQSSEDQGGADMCVCVCVSCGYVGGQLAKVKGCNPQKIKAVPAASVNRGVASPPDISMDVTRIVLELGIELTPFENGLRTFIKA
eukprot:994275-Pyramimonas_sp.AAC.1